MPKFSLIQDAQTLSTIKGSDEVATIKEVQRTTGKSFHEAAKLVEGYPRITQNDYDEWLRQIVLSAEDYARRGMKMSLNKKANFSDVVGEILENDPAHGHIQDTPELFSSVVDALWKKYHHTKEHLRVEKGLQAKEEEEMLKRISQEVEDEEDVGGYLAHRHAVRAAAIARQRGGEDEEHSGWTPSEGHLEVLDDYMHNRGHFVGSDADGHVGLKAHHPELTSAQRQKAINAWKRESNVGSEDEELNVSVSPKPEATDEFVPSTSNYDTEDMSDSERGEAEGGEEDLHSEEGMEHHEEDASQECPYEEGTPEHDAWMAGFEAGIDSEAGEESDVGDEHGEGEGEVDFEGGEVVHDTEPMDHEHEVSDDVGRHELEHEVSLPHEENEEVAKGREHPQYTKGFLAAKNEYHTGLKAQPQRPHPQWDRGYEDFMQDTEGQREMARVTRGATDEEEMSGSSTRLSLKDVLRSPKTHINAALKKVEDDGAHAFHAITMPKNPHPDKSLAHRAWAKGFKTTAKDIMGFHEKPAPVKGKAKKK